MSRSLLLLAIAAIAHAAVATAADAPEVTPSLSAVAPVLLPAPQTSVTSTAFNPNIQNAGGTTNSAGTFNVVSLARSSSYAGAGQIPKTTSYVIGDPNFASAQSRVTPDYFTETSSASSTPAPEPTSSDISLIGLNAGQSVIAESSNAALAQIISPYTYNNLGSYMLTVAGIAAAAVAVL